MGLSNYTSVVAAIQEIIEDDSQEVSVFIPTAIFLAQERVNKDLDSKKLIAEVSITTSDVSVISIGVSGNLTKVSTSISSNDFLSFRNVYYKGEKLDQVDISFVKEINRYETTIGASARYYAYVDTPNTIYVAPPVSSGKFSIEYNTRENKISSTKATNTLLAEFPELVLYASLSEMSKFLKNWDTNNIWENSYTNALASNLNTTRKERTDIGQKHFNTSETQSTAGGQ